MDRPLALLVTLTLVASGCVTRPSTGTSALSTPSASVALPSPSPLPSTTPGAVAEAPPTATPTPSASALMNPGFDTPIVDGSGAAPTPPPSVPIAVTPGSLPARERAIAFASWSSAGRKIALTFDDGGSARAIRGVVAVAAATRTPVTFFPFGRSLAAHPALWRAIAAAGFPIGNHTLGHRFLEKLRLRSGEAAVAGEIRGFADRAAAYGIPLIPVFRPPYGAHSGAVDAIAAAAGFPYIATWNTTFADTAPLCRGSVAGRFDLATRGRRGAIVLAHVSDELTPRILAAVIAHYRERNLTPVALPELLGGTPAVIDWGKAAAIGGPLPVPLDVTDRTRTPAAQLGRVCPS